MAQTAFAAGGDPDQNIWETIAGDSGSTTADQTDDTLTITGGTNVTTSVTDNTVTIDATGTGDPDQNLYETITDGTNTATAGTTTDTFKIRSSDSTITPTVANDDVTHGDNVDLIVNQGNIDHVNIYKTYMNRKSILLGRKRKLYSYSLLKVT